MTAAAEGKDPGHAITMDEDENLSMLLSMGFPDIGEIKRALRLAKNDINEAVAILTNEQPLSSYGTLDDLSADIDMRDVSTANERFIGPINNPKGGSNVDPDAIDTSDSANNIEFPVTNLYELDQRVFHVSFDLNQSSFKAHCWYFRTIGAYLTRGRSLWENA